MNYADMVREWDHDLAAEDADTEAVALVLTASPEARTDALVGMACQMVEELRDAAKRAIPPLKGTAAAARLQTALSRNDPGILRAFRNDMRD